MAWQAPSLTVKWGSYFQPDPADQKQIVELVKAALDSKAITKRHAVEKLAPIFGIENVEAALEAIEEESQAQAASELERTQNELAAAHALTNGDSNSKAPSGRGGAGSGSDPKQAPGVIGRGAPAAKPKA